MTKTTAEKIFKYSIITLIVFGFTHFIVLDFFNTRSWYIEVKEIVFWITNSITLVVFVSFLVLVLAFRR